MTRPHPEWRDYSAEMRKHDSLTVRLLFLALGTAFVALGIAGAFLPVLPTTPFMLLAAACYARASSRFYNWLLNHRWFGPTIIEWRRYRSIPYRVKWTAIVLMAVTLSISIVFFVPWLELQLALAAFGVMLALYLYHIPSRDRPRGRR
ncbi:MAG: YbaN family protein [Gammaproteobacteria bacterium]|nr:YbaN family protein [Gammaproteobacteria bacterium]